MARFGQALKVICFPQFQNPPNWHHLPSHNPPLALPSHLPIGGTNCFYWASKLLHGTFWPGLKTFKSPAAAFESLSTAQPSACFAIVPPHRPFKLFLLDFETATWHVLARPSFGKPQHRTTLRLLCHCFYWASKLLHGTFWPGLKTLKSPAAAFESLSTAQPSACFAIVPPHHLPSHNPPLALPSYLPIGGTNCFYWASKLLHGTFWPGLGTTCHRTTLRLLCHRTSPSEVQTVSIGLRNCYMARFGQALKPSKAPQQLSRASAPHNPPLALPSYLPIGPSNCFYWASKLLHGTFFWPGLLLGSLSTAQPSACFAIVPPHRPYKLFLLGFETATWHVLARP